MSIAPSQLQHEALDWLDEAFVVLRRSAWSDALRLEDVDVLDAMCNPLFLTVLHLTREFDELSRQPSAPIRMKRALIQFGYQAKLRWQETRAAFYSPMPEPARVLFLPQLNSHLKQTLPLVAELQTLGVSTALLLSRPNEFSRLRRTEPKATFVGRAYPRELQAARRSAARAATRLRSDPGITLPPFLREASQKFLVDQLRAAISLHLPAVFAAAAGCKAAVENLHPEVLVVGNDVTLEGRTQCMIANARGLLTVCPMHGIIAGSPLQGRHIAEAFLVYGERSKQELIQLGENPQRLHVCGAIHLSRRERQTGRVHPQVKEFLQLEDNMPWVLLATSGPGHSVSLAHHQHVIEAAARLSVAMPDVRFGVKLHPKDRMAYYEAAQRKIPNSRLFVAPHDAPPALGDILTWLHGCDAVITGGSTVGLEALLMNVPVISIDLADELSGIDLIQAGASLHVTTEAELAKAVDLALHGRERLSDLRAKSLTFLQGSFHAADDNAARIAAEMIMRLQAARIPSSSTVAAAKPVS